MLLRRGRVGMRLSGDPSPRVLSVTPDGPAARAGIHPGSILDNRSRQALSRCRAGVSITLWVDGSPRTLSPEALPDETWEGSRVDYRWVTARDGTALRVIDVGPREGHRATVLYAQGYDLGSVERIFAAETDPLRGLIGHLAGAGYTVRRLERRGVGDSAGDAPWDTPWETERGDLAAAMPEGPTVIFGHSLGANHAAALAGDPRVRALAVYGAGADRWRDYLAENLRRQLAAAGLGSTDIEAISLAHNDFVRAVFDDGTVPTDLPAALRAWFGVDDGGAVHGRAAHYWRAVDREDLAAPFAARAAPTLVLWGSRDAVTTRDEHARVADLAGGALAVIEADHGFADAQGAYVPAVGDALVAWMDQYV